MSLRYKLTFSIAGILAAVMIVAVLFQIYEIRASYRQNLEYARHSLFNAQKENMKNITVAVASIFEYFDKRVKDGELTLEEAKTQAKEQIRVIRYDMENKALKGGNYFWIDETSGDNILHPITPQIEGKNRIKALDANNMEMIRAIIESGMRGGDFTEFYYEKPGESAGKQKVGYSIEFNPWKWVIGTGFWSEDWNAAINANVTEWQTQAESYLNTLIFYTIAGFAALLVLVLAITFVYTKKFVKPIVELSRISEEMANGNLRVEISEKGESHDEIGALRKSMRHMAGSLSSLLRQINESSVKLFDASEVLSASSGQTVRSTEEVVSTVGGITMDTRTQLDAVRNITAAIERITSGIDNVASISAMVSEKSTQASEVAEDGSKSLVEAVRQMDNISNTTKQTAGAIKRLGEKSRKINDIVSLISAISDQTNLLALNAAIEAARAGESGRGFAVVAEEVRKLAEQSRQASDKITEEIIEIQKDTENAVDLMNAGVTESEKGVDVVTKNGEMFKKIIVNITELNDEILSITSLTKDLSDSSKLVHNSAEDLGKVCTKTSDAAKNIAEASQEQSADITEIANSSQKLYNIAGDMQEQVARFSIDDYPALETTSRA
ncbi:MAG: methyl-accepting chemotaxis protein [Synergistaceae bacterium]|jgi:methyl-accepting chemotaxis protein|nr:methyl-accepting chemotaxis protein [Synergistaceae bacterium]